jgi:mannose-6-phosphate isomerase-like protein (cupin superfamily)
MTFESIQNKISLKWLFRIILLLTVVLVVYGFYAKLTSLKSIKVIKNMSYHTNIIKETEDNEYFRRVLFTGANSQLVVMSIVPGGEVGKETHKHTEQTLFFLSGKGEGELDGKKFPIVPGDVVVVVPGTEHNFWNIGTEPLKIYAPPNHIDGRIHKTKADADADTADEAVGEKPPL